MNRCPSAQSPQTPREDSARIQRAKLRRRACAFSLVEIALALGVVAFCIVAILGLIQVAQNAAREGRAETRATLIARSIMETARAGNPGSAIIETAPGTLATITLPPASPATYDLVYSDQGELLASPGNYDTGAGMPPAASFVARVVFTPRPDGLVQLEVGVATPAIAPQSRRKNFPFVTLISPRFAAATP